jgi:hypothetical protein
MASDISELKPNIKKTDNGGPLKMGDLKIMDFVVDVL